MKEQLSSLFIVYFSKGSVEGDDFSSEILFSYSSNILFKFVRTSVISLPSARESLDQKRDKVHGNYFSNLSATLDTLFSYRFTNSCYPWDHPDCEHAFLAQDHHKEGVIEGQFIRKSK